MTTSDIFPDHERWSFLPEPKDFPDYRQLLDAGTISRKDACQLYERVEQLLHHEDELLNTRLEGFLIASALLAGVYTQLLPPQRTLLATVIAAAGMVLSGVMLNILQRTAAAGAWFMTVLLQLEEVLMPEDLRPQWRRRKIGLSAAKMNRRIPVGVVLGHFIPWASVLVWLLLFGYAIAKTWGTGRMNIELISWIAQIAQGVVVVVLVPVALYQLWLQIRATRDQTRGTLLQTIATVISWVQAEDIRRSRKLLFELEEKSKISSLPAVEWDAEWKEAADRVSQCFNSAAIVVQHDVRMHEIWIRPTCRTILRTWEIVQPRVKERRNREGLIWSEFDWLAKKASTYHRVADRSG